MSSYTVSRSYVAVNAWDTQSDNPDSILWRGLPVKQAVHPSRVGRLVANSRQLSDHCRILQILKLVGCKMAGVWTMLPLAQTTIRWFPDVHTGIHSINVSLLKAPNKCFDLTLTFNIIVRLFPRSTFSDTVTSLVLEAACRFATLPFYMSWYHSFYLLMKTQLHMRQLESSLFSCDRSFRFNFIPSVLLIISNFACPDAIWHRLIRS